MKHYFPFILFIAFVMIVSCNKNQCEVVNSPLSSVENDYTLDAAMNTLSAALSSALCNHPNIIEIIKSEVTKKRDGDYDVLYNDLSNIQISLGDQTKGGEGIVPIGDIIALYLPDYLHTKNTVSYLEELIARYPTLQVSVPVHSEQLSEESIPSVAFVPDGLSDAEINYLPGYNGQGEPIQINAREEPDAPVIIISVSERLRSVQRSASTPLPPTNVTATQSSSSIVLSWNSVTGAVCYKVYRKGQGETTFSLCGASTGMNNTSFEDTNIIASRTYSYYVTTYGWGEVNGESMLMESTPSNTVTIAAPSVMPAVENFEVSSVGNSLKLYWNNSGYTDCDIRLDYYDPGSSPITINNITTVSGSGSNYYFYYPTNSLRGKRIFFQATRITNLGSSDTVEDFIYPPFRNADHPSPIKLKRIDLGTTEQLNAIEPWYRGAPEFYFKLAGVNNSGNTIELVNQLEFRFDGRTTYQNFNDIIYQWVYDHYYKWYSSLRVYIEEGDTDNTHTFSASSQVGIKLENIVEFSIGPSYSASFSTTGQFLGGIDLYYYENPVKTATTQNYNVAVSFGW